MIEKSDKGLKLIVLKPMVWNGGGYLGPAGSRSAGGFVAEHGYGHEEWNGDPDRQWRQFRIFHTESKGRMDQFAADGQLGMIMTAYRPHMGPVALGIATSVASNTPEERELIARLLNLKEEGERVWALPSVRAKFGSRAAFDRHWRQNYTWVRWRAPVDQYVWFDEPLPIDPEGIFPSGDTTRPRRDIAKRHGGYMAIRPDQALAIVGKSIDPGHPVVAWLRSADFDASAVSSAVRKAKSPKANAGSAAPTASAYVRYLESQEIEITPRHHDLQSRFRRFIASQCTELAENRRCVDLQYICPKRGFVLVEVKPCDVRTARFAIRTALGQLLDYRQSASRSPSLLIVLDVEPPEERDIQLALDNGVGIAWPTRRTFSVRWPV